MAKENARHPRDLPVATAVFENWMRTYLFTNDGYRESVTERNNPILNVTP
jgi:hypothetical protein